MSYQTAVVNSVFTRENLLDSKQTVDAVSGEVANDLLTAQINGTSFVLNADLSMLQSAATAGNDGDWSTSDSQTFNQDNTTYQNDLSVSQTGQNNASAAVQALQTQVSQDGTNISNAISLGNTLVQIGQYASSMLSQAYTAS